MSIKMREYRGILEILCALIALFLPMSIAKGPRVTCQPNWVSAGDGRVPHDALHCSEFNGEFISRVNHPTANVWLAGRIIPSTGKTWVPYLGAVLEFDQYQVLVFPEYCEYKWVESDVLPEHVVAINNDPNFLIGRTAYDDTSSYSYCGTLDVQSNALSVVDMDFNFQVKNRHEYLVSVYPEITAELTNFRFTNPPLNTQVNAKELVGHNKLTISGARGADYNHKCLHSRMYPEEFHFQEDPFEWRGVKELVIKFPSFLTTRGLKTNSLVNEADTQISFEIERLLEEDAYIENNRGNGTTPPAVLVEVCTVANIIDGVDFPFTATITFKSDKLPSASIEHVLNELGRPPAITSNLQGVFSGRFVHSMEVFVGDHDPNGLCAAKLIP